MVNDVGGMDGGGEVGGDAEVDEMDEGEVGGDAEMDEMDEGEVGEMDGDGEMDEDVAKNEKMVDERRMMMNDEKRFENGVIVKDG